MSIKTNELISKNIYLFMSKKLPMNSKKAVILALIAFVIITSGCITGKASEKADNTGTGDTMAKNSNRFAVIETNKGIIKFELFEKEAPITTSNFIQLAGSGFYNGLKFHRVEKGFVIQGGDPKGDGTGGSNKTIPLEINRNLTHKTGSVGMARTQDPNSATSQFYITLAPANFLDGNYAVFGQVVEGMDIAEKIAVGDKMMRVYITSGLT